MLLTTSIEGFTLRAATKNDTATILGFIKELAEYEKLAHEVVATEATLHETLFGDTPYAKVIMAELNGTAVGYALYFHNFSTFTGRPGIYLEDLYVTPSARGSGVGRALLKQLAQIAVQQDCGRFEWSVLDWNEPAIKFYESVGAKAQNEWVIYRLTGQDLVDFTES